MIEERDLLRSTVRTCIMQKRVSFAFFKQWYWDCFDDDVQVYNRHLSDSQRDAVKAEEPSHGASDLWEGDNTTNCTLMSVQEVTAGCCINATMSFSRGRQELLHAATSDSMCRQPCGSCTQPLRHPWAAHCPAQKYPATLRLAWLCMDLGTLRRPPWSCLHSRFPRAVPEGPLSATEAKRFR